MILLIVVIPQLLGLHFLDEMGSISFLSAIVITAGSDYVYVIEKRPDFLIAGEFSPFGKSEGYGTEYQTRDAGEDPLLTDGDCFSLLYVNDYGEAGIFAICKSDIMKQAETYIRGNRIILGSISIILLLAGLTNYFNVILTGM